MDQWLMNVAVKKAAYGAAKALLTLVVSAKAVALESKFGITIDPTTFQASAAAAFLAAVEALHDWAKLKFPNVKWL